MLYPHPSTEIANISLKTSHFPHCLVRGLLTVSRSSALKLTFRKASRCLFLELSSASPSLSLGPPATLSGLCISLPWHLSVDKSLHLSNSSNRSYSLLMEDYPWVKLQIPGQVRTSTHESYYITPCPKYPSLHAPNILGKESLGFI